MSANLSPIVIKAHDPDGTRLRTIKVALDSGDSLLNTTTLTPVNEQGGALVGDTFTATIESMGLIAAGGAAGDIWGVNYRLRGGSLGAHWIRLRPFLASQPSEPAYDQTFAVLIAQT